VDDRDGSSTRATAPKWKADPEQRKIAKKLGTRLPAQPVEVPDELKALSFRYNRHRAESMTQEEIDDEIEEQVYEKTQYLDLDHLIVVETDLSDREHCLANLPNGPHPGIIREDRDGEFWFQYIGAGGDPHSIRADRIVRWAPLLSD